MGTALAERQLREMSLFSERDSLAYDIEHFRKYWQEEGLPHNWRDLPGTGFQIQRQMRMLAGDLVKVTSLGERRDKFAGWLAKTDKDTRAFTLEYLAEGLVFPIRYEISWVDGELRLIAPLYGNKLMVDTVSEKERNGSVKRALGDQVEPFLLTAPNGSIAVMTSPSGWTGMRDEQGNEIRYPDSQTYILQKRGKDIVGFAMRTDFILGEHSELLRTLKVLYGLEYSVPDEHASVCDFVETVATITPSEEDIAIEDIVDVMKIVRSNLSQKTDAYKGRGWQEAYEDLARGDELWYFDRKIEKMVAEFIEYSLYRALTMEDVQESLAVTILRIAKFLRGKNLLKPVGISPKGGIDFLPITFGAVFKDVQSIPGCAGGGAHTLVNSLTPRHSLTEEIMYCVTCPFCKEVVDAILTQDKIICPKCEKSADR